MSKPGSDELNKAKQYAFLLLKFRLRSENELCRRLKEKKFDDRAIGEVIAFLKEKEFIGDDYFARAWIESRIKKPLGLARLRQELRLKGVDKQIIERQISRIKQDYSEDEAVKKIAAEKFRKLKGIDPKKAKNRLYGWLIRRGFSPDTVIEAINRLYSQI